MTTNRLLVMTYMQYVGLSHYKFHTTMEFTVLMHLKWLFIMTLVWYVQTNVLNIHLLGYWQELVWYDRVLCKLINTVYEIMKQVKFKFKI